MKVIEVSSTRHGTRPDLCVVQLTTDSGLAGVAVCGIAAQDLINDLSRESVIGKDPRAVAALWQQLSGPATASRLAAEARGALDIAIWDLKSKSYGEPLWKTLGASRRRLNAHVRGFPLALDDRRLATKLESVQRDAGFRNCALELSLDAQISARRFCLAQSIIGRSGDRVLIAELGEQWSPDDAIRVLGTLEDELDIAWVRAPAVWGPLALADVADRLRAGMSIGTQFCSLAEFLPYLRQECVDVVELDVAHLGISGALELADAAFGFELPVVLNSMPGDMHVQLAGALPNCMSVALDCDDRAGSAHAAATEIKEGWAFVGADIGNGLRVPPS